MSRGDAEVVLNHEDIYEFNPPEVEQVKSEYQNRIRLYRLFIAGTVISMIIILISLVVVYVFHTTSNSKGNVNTNDAFTGNITVLFAASLKDVMNRLIIPDFQSSYFIRVNALYDTSGNLATDLQGGMKADIFMSADSSYNVALMKSSVKGSKQFISSWYTYWTRSRLGIAFSTKSPFVNEFRCILNGSKNWFDVLDHSIMKIGRTDPNTDPKGYRTIILTRLAEIFYNRSGIVKQVLGSPTNNLQIYSEANLESLLVNGDIDAGFFYEGEHAWDTQNKFIPLDRHIDMSDPALNWYYTRANYTGTKGVKYGSAIIYTITITNSALNIAGATTFVRYLRSLVGSTELTEEGLFVYPDQSFLGNLSTVPKALRINTN